MSIVSTTRSEAAFCNAKVPWVTFLFLVIVFFVTENDLFIALEGSDKVEAEFMATTVAEGSLMRRVAFLMLGLFGVVSLLRKGRSGLRINGSLGWLILFYLVWTMWSLAWAYDTVLTFRRLFLLAMFCLGAVAVAARFSLRNIVLWVFFSATLCLVIGLFAEIGLGTFRPFVLEYRFRGTTHPNSQGLYCGLLLLAGVGASQSVKRGQKIFLAFALVGLVFLILTKSRTSFASAIIALFVYWSLVSSTSRKFALILGVSFTFCLFLLLFGEAVFQAIQQGILLGRGEDSTITLTGRIALWEQCIEYVAQRPFIGYGYGSFWTPRHILEISDKQGWSIGLGHSTYLELLLNVGLIGMIAFVLIYILGIKESVKYLHASKDTGYAFLCAVLVLCLLDGILEAIIVFPNMITFLSMVSLTHLGFKCPEAGNPMVVQALDRHYDNR